MEILEILNNRIDNLLYDYEKLKLENIALQQEIEKLKNENAYLKQENKTVQDLKSKNKKLEDDYWDLDLKKRLQEKDFSKEKEIFSKFVESSNSLKIQYYNFKKELKEKEKVKVRGKSQGMER